MDNALPDITDEINHHGYVYLENFYPNLTTLQVGNMFGNTMEIPGIPIVQRITPREQTQSTMNVYSGNYGLGAFPQHTDLAHWHIPPHYLILRCIVPGPNVLTSVTDFSACLRTLPENAIRRAQFLPRRSINGKKHLLRLFQKLATCHLLRWDELFIVPANHEAFEVRNHLAYMMARYSTTQISFVSPADTLIIDNWKMLHGRSPVPASGLKRLVERVYLTELKK